MMPKVNSGNTVTVSRDINNLKKGDIVFCKVKGKHYIHLVSATRGDQYQIANNKGRANGWVTKKAIFGKVVKICS